MQTTKRKSRKTRKEECNLTYYPKCFIFNHGAHPLHKGNLFLEDVSNNNNNDL